MLYMTFQHKAESRKKKILCSRYLCECMIHKFVSWGKAFIFFLGADKHHENEYELQSVQYCTHIPKIAHTKKKRISVYIFVVYL